MAHWRKIIFALVFLPSLLFADAQFVVNSYQLSASAGNDYLLDGNIAWAYYMNNNGGDETDRSGNGQTLTQSSAPPTDATVPSSFSGTSRLFDDTDPDKLERADDNGANDITGTAISFGAFFRTDDKSNDQTIIAKGSPGTDRQYYLRYDTSSDVFICAIAENSTTFHFAQTATGATNGIWYHVWCNYDGANIQTYLNGSASGSPTAYTGSIADGGGSFRVGTFGGSGHMSGYIDEPSGLDRSCSSAEINEIYTYGIDGDRGGND